MSTLEGEEVNLLRVEKMQKQMKMKQDEERLARAEIKKFVKEREKKERKKILNMNCFQTFVD